MWPGLPSIPAWTSPIFSQSSFFKPLSSSSGPSHRNPNDVLDKWSISWQLQHLSPWQSCPQRWLRHSSFWGSSSSPPIMSGSGGEMQSWWGRVGVGVVVGGCWPLCAVKRGRPTTQTDMLTANTNIAKQMVHAYLFRFPFKCTPQLCESALSSIEGRTYQLPSSLLTIKRTFHSGTMRGLLLSLSPESLPDHV